MSKDIYLSSYFIQNYNKRNDDKKKINNKCHNKIF